MKHVELLARRSRSKLETHFTQALAICAAAFSCAVCRSQDVASLAVPDPTASANVLPATVDTPGTRFTVVFHPLETEFDADDDLRDVLVRWDPTHLGYPVRLVTTIRNFEPVPREYCWTICIEAETYTRQPVAQLWKHVEQTGTVEPFGSVRTEIVLPWWTVKQWVDFTHSVEAIAVVRRSHDSNAWLEFGHAYFDELPLTVSLSPAARVLPGGTVTATITYENPLPTPLSEARLELDVGSNMRFQDGNKSEVITLGDLPAGAKGSVTRQLSSLYESSQGSLTARLFGDGLDGEASGWMRIGYCRADFNRDGDVTPDDLGDYIKCFVATRPWATCDMTDDDLIDRDDLVEFLSLYFGPPC